MLHNMINTNCPWDGCPAHARGWLETESPFRIARENIDAKDMLE